MNNSSQEINDNEKVSEINTNNFLEMNQNWYYSENYPEFIRQESNSGPVPKINYRR